MDGATNGTLVTNNVNNIGTVSGTCGMVNCSASGTIADSSSYSSFPNGSDITTNWGQSITVSPGSYDDLRHGGNGTIFMEPGVYTFEGRITSNSLASIEVAPSFAGTVAIFVDGDVDLGYQFRLNTSNPDGFVFIYSTDDIFAGNEAVINAVFYAEDDVYLRYQTQVTGSVTAVDRVDFQNESSVIYDASVVANTDFYSFCSNVPSVPVLVAEWRLDELSWSGANNEVLDNGPNALHGRAVAVTANQYPSSDFSNPAIGGNPGTCSYGDFNGTADGYVLIDDPGNNSVLDLTEFTVTNWVYTRGYPGSGLQTIVSKDENFEYHLDTSGRVNWWWGGGSRELTSSSAIPLNEWHHIAITFERGEQHIYIDGVSNENNNSTAAITTNNDGVHIGTDWDFHSRRFNGLIDEVRIYDAPLSQAEVAAVMAETHPCTNLPSLDHFAIDIGTGSASTCVPSEITITAEDASNNTINDYIGTVAISTSTNNGNWSKTATPSDALGALTPAALDSGAADYQFEQSEADGGSIVLNLANSHAETLTLTVEDTSAGVSSTSASITFSENAFVVTSIDSLGDDVVAGRDHQFQVQMVREDPVTGACGPADEYDVADVKVWMTRAVSDPGGIAPSVSNSAATDTETLADTEPGSANFTLPFVDGGANFSLSTNDAGRYALNFLDDASGFSSSDISGGSSTLVARPFAFDIQVSGNPAADSSTGSTFKLAGEIFDASVRVVAWDAADDADDNGIADGHDDSDPTSLADLSDNNVLPAYGLENPSEGVQLSAVLLQPTGGNDPGLASNLASPADARQLTSFSGGTASTADIYYPEVGIIEIAARVLDGDYLGAGAAVTSRAQGRSGYVGRFWPSYFTLTADLHTPACNTGGFSYMGESFLSEYTLSAISSRNVLTQNYTGGFARFDPNGGLGSADYGAIDSGSSTQLSSRTNAATTVAWGLGSAAVDAQMTLARTSLPDGPYNAVNFGAYITDADGASLRAGDLDLDVDGDSTNDHMNIGQSTSLFGRLRLSDAFGPETAALPVIFATEYWDGSLWRTSVDDDCTLISLADIDYPNGRINVPTNRIVTVGAGSTTGNYANLFSGNVVFTGGEAGHFFSAPGAGNTGSFQVEVNLNAYPWLRFDWNMDGSFDDLTLPSASYSFGSYRGHDRVIYWREVLVNPPPSP